MAVIDLAGFVADLKDHAVEHGFHVHDERHFVESYSLRQNWEVDLHPEEGCDGPVDLVLDPLFGVPAAAALRNLRGGGRLVNLGASAGEISPIDSATLRSRQLQVLGYTNNELSVQARLEALTHVVEEVLAGRLTVEHQRVPLAEVAQAWNRPGGRVVLVP